jgi:hypothetical protein
MSTNEAFPSTFANKENEVHTQQTSDGLKKQQQSTNDTYVSSPPNNFPNSMSKLPNHVSANAPFTNAEANEPSEGPADAKGNADRSSYSGSNPNRIGADFCTEQATNPKVLLHRMHQTYISPSDTIMSPATAKLAAFKNKHLSKG